MSNYTYEDKSSELEEILSKYRSKWQLDALAWLDYDDVCQIIRTHIWKKWHLWDQDRPFKPWAAMVISHQMMNLVRNNYSNFARPCLKCPFFMGADGCSFTKSKIQDSECEIFAKWQKKKEKAYNLTLALPIEDGSNLGECSIEDEIDFDKAQHALHKAVTSQLSGKHLEIYKLLFIKNMEDSEIAEIYGFKKDSSKRKTVRYKQLCNLKKRFYEMAKKALQEQDIL
jgi:RNA polymerase sigma factor (sigma-70 family)